MFFSFSVIFSFFQCRFFGSSEFVFFVSRGGGGGGGVDAAVTLVQRSPCRYVNVTVGLESLRVRHCHSCRHSVWSSHR